VVSRMKKEIPHNKAKLDKAVDSLIASVNQVKAELHPGKVEEREVSYLTKCGKTTEKREAENDCKRPHDLPSFINNFPNPVIRHPESLSSL